MSSEIEKLLAPPGLESTAFPHNSRYHGAQTKVVKSRRGEPVVQLKRRFVPPPENFALLQFHTVLQGERLDNIVHKYLGDPEQFWRICDANSAIRPNDLTDTARDKLRITLPEGIPGATDA